MTGACDVVVTWALKLQTSLLPRPAPMSTHLTWLSVKAGVMARRAAAQVPSS
jgi:hypothetical protein